MKARLRMKVPALVLLLIIETSRDYDSTKASVSTKESVREIINVQSKAHTPIRKKTAKNVTKGAAEWYYRHFCSNCSACCFENLSISNTTSCSASSPHSFCFGCAQRNADEGIVKARYILELQSLSQLQSCLYGRFRMYGDLYRSGNSTVSG